ncbi:MAG: hypothetical protein ACTSWK_16865 [Promethearchaeota archaeon]
MTESKLSKYKFVKEVPRDTVRVPGFLSGEFGRDFLEEYQGRAKADYGDAKALKDIRRNNDKVVGSNPYLVVLANQILGQVGLSVATSADVENMLKSRSLDLKRTDIDTGLVLTCDCGSGMAGIEGEPNGYLARDLRKQLGENKLPVMIPLTGLDLRFDSESPSGLAFDLREDAEIIYGEILTSLRGKFVSADVDDKTGLPRKLDGGNREFVGISCGLSRLLMERGGSKLSARVLNFNYSPDGGRVVFVDPKVSEAA